MRSWNSTIALAFLSSRPCALHLSLSLISLTHRPSLKCTHQTQLALKPLRRDKSKCSFSSRQWPIRRALWCCQGMFVGQGERGSERESCEMRDIPYRGPLWCCQGMCACVWEEGGTCKGGTCKIYGGLVVLATPCRGPEAFRRGRVPVSGIGSRAIWFRVKASRR